MQWLTAAFLAALLLGTAVRLWLGHRQICAARAHREQVPAPFRDQVSVAENQKAADYAVARAHLSRIEMLVDAVIVLALTLGGGIAFAASAWSKLGWREPWQGLALVASVLLLTGLLGEPFSLWRTFRIEAAFGFNRTTWSLYLIDRAKGLLLGVLIGAPLLLGALFLMQHGGRWWWIYTWAAWIVVSLALTWAWPAVIAPLFNRFSPLADEALKARIEALLGRCGFTSQGVFVVDGSRRSAHGNAYFTGVGRNKRIVFFDTLLERLAPQEVEAVLAHELGHFRLHHIRARIIVSAVTSLAALAILATLLSLPAASAALGVPIPRGATSASAASTLLLFAFVAPAFSFFATPLTAWWSRVHEFAADRFACAHTEREQLASALVKLYRDNATPLAPDAIVSGFYDSHPPAIARIAQLRAPAARA